MLRFETRFIVPYEWFLNVIWQLSNRRSLSRPHARTSVMQSQFVPKLVPHGPSHKTENPMISSKSRSILIDDSMVKRNVGQLGLTTRVTTPGQPHDQSLVLFARKSDAGAPTIRKTRDGKP